MGRLLTMYGIEASIKTAAEEETWAPLDDGFDNVAEALNETVQQYYFLKDKGFARNHVTGMAPAFTLTTCDVTLCNIQEWSGAATDDSAISVEIRFDGAPEVSTSPTV